MRREDLVMADIKLFYPGLRLDFPVYFHYMNCFLRVFSDLTIGTEEMETLRRYAAMGWNLYVQKGDRGKLESAYAEAQPSGGGAGRRPGKQSPPQHLDNLDFKLKLCAEYNGLAEQAAALLEAAETGSVPTEQIAALSAAVSEEVERISPPFLLQCVNTLRRVEDYVHIHSLNVALLDGLLGRWLGMERADCDRLVQTGLLHDLGKAQVPQGILNKPSVLTPEEYEQVKAHAADSEEIARRSGIGDGEVLAGVRGHHERMDGSGYPDSLRGDAIPLFARVTGVCDVYDAMVAKRPYKDRRSPVDILAEFASHGEDLDPDVVGVFLKNVSRELIDKRVVLSDGRMARIVRINPEDFAHPVVRIGQRELTLSDELRCVAMDNVLSLWN